MGGGGGQHDDDSEGFRLGGVYRGGGREVETARRHQPREVMAGGGCDGSDEGDI